MSAACSRKEADGSNGPAPTRRIRQGGRPGIRVTFDANFILGPEKLAIEVLSRGLKTVQTVSSREKSRETCWLIWKIEPAAGGLGGYSVLAQQDFLERILRHVVVTILGDQHLVFGLTPQVPPTSPAATSRTSPCRAERRRRIHSVRNLRDNEYGYHRTANTVHHHPVSQWNHAVR